MPIWLIQKSWLVHRDHDAATETTTGQAIGKVRCIARFWISAGQGPSDLFELSERDAMERMKEYASTWW